MNLLKEMGYEKFMEAALKLYTDKAERLTAEVAQTEKQLKKMKRELKQAESTLEVLEMLKNGGIEL